MAVGTVEQLSIIRAALDPSGYQTGAQAIERANANIAKSQDQVQKTSATTTRAMEGAERAFVKTARAADPLARELLAFQQAQERANRAVTLGVATQEQASAVILQYRARVDAAVAAKQRLTGAAVQTTNAVGLTGRQMQQLAPQINDVATSLLGGASAFQVLTQQGGQITQAMGGVGNTFRAIGSLITPMRAAVVGTTVALGAAVLAFEATESRLARLQNTLRVTRGDWQAFAAELDRRSRDVAPSILPFSTADTQQTMSRLAQVLPTDLSSQLERLTRLAADLSRTLDTDAASAAQRLTRMYSDLEGEVRSLSERAVPGFTEAFRRHIEVMVAEGRSADAYMEVIQRLETAFGGARDNIRGTEAAALNLARAWDNVRIGTTRFLETAGAPLIRFFGDIEHGAARFEAAINSIARATLAAINPLQQFRNIGEAIFNRPINIPGTIGSGVQAPGAPSAAPTAAGATVYRGARGETFQSALGQVESGNRYDNGSNPYGYLGRYQFGAPALYDLGLYTPSASEMERHRRGRGIGNNWEGTFSNGGQGRDAFLSDPGLQDTAFERFVQRLDAIIDRAGLVGRDVGGVPASRDALRAAGWLYPGHLERFATSGGSFNPSDAFGHSMMARFTMFSPRDGAQATGAARPGQAAAPAAVAPPGAPAAAPAASATGTGTAQTRESDRLYRESAGGRTAEDELSRARIAAREAEIARITTGAAGRDMTAEETQRVQALTEAIERETAAINGRETAAQRSIRTGQATVRVMQTEDDLRREIARRVTDAREAARSEGRSLTSREQQAIEAQARQESAAQREDQIRANDRLVRSEQAVAQAYLSGARSGMESAARQQALNEARRTEIVGTEEWRATVERLTQQYLRLGLSRSEAQLGQQLVQQEQTLALLRAENDAVGRNTQERQRNLAVRREIARLEGIHPDLPNTEAGRRSITNASRIADEQLRGHNLNRIEGYGREAGAIIGKGITDAIRTGSMRGFKDIPGMLWEIMARGLITKPLEEWFASMARNLFNTGGGGGGGGFLGSIGSFLGFGGGGATKAFSAVSFDALPVLHGGGVAGNATTFRMADPADWAGAPRYHSGRGPGSWTAPNEIRAILERDEVVLNRRQQQRAASAMRPALGRGVTIVQNVTTPDAASFNRSQAQQAARARRAFGRFGRSV